MMIHDALYIFHQNRGLLHFVNKHAVSGLLEKRHRIVHGIITDMHILHAEFFIIREKMLQQRAFSRLPRPRDRYNRVVVRCFSNHLFYFPVDIIHFHFYVISESDGKNT